MSGRISDADRQAKARDTLVQTLCKIRDSDPTLGGKWRTKMVDYYVERLAELVLRQCGFDNPSVLARVGIADTIREILSTDGMGS